jgi:hypothetical protein
MYFGGAAPDNQNYSPYNTPDANTAAEGKTGGPVTHRTYENTLITNVLGSQGTSDRSQWRYHQPVYCKTFTETVRSDSPGLMSSPLRYVYRGHATQYNESYNFGPGFDILNYDKFGGGCDIPPPCPTTTGDPLNPLPGDTLRGSSYCTYTSITWYNTGSSEPIGTGDTYTIQESDYFYKIYYVVTYPNGSTASSSVDCLGLIVPDRNYDFWALTQQPVITDIYPNYRKVLQNEYGEVYIIFWTTVVVQYVNKALYKTLNIQKRDINGVELWTFSYPHTLGLNYQVYQTFMATTFDSTQDNIYVAAKFREYKGTPGFVPYWDGVELYRINAADGSLIWRHTYSTGFSAINLKDIAGISVDNYLNKVWFSVLSFNICGSLAVDVDDPTDLYGGLDLTHSDGATVGYPKSITIFRSYDNNKLIFVWDDDSNRHVIFEGDITGLNINSTVKRISSFTSVRTTQDILCKFVSATANDGSTVYVGAQGMSEFAARLILYDQDFNPIKYANSYGYVKNITVDPSDNTKVYTTVFSAPEAHLNDCGIDFGDNSFCAVYGMDGSLDTINSCVAFTTYSGYSFMPPPNAETSDYSTTVNPYVNRAVITYTPYYLGVDTGGQITGQLTVGLPVTGSGNVSNFAWPNASGLIGAKDNLSVPISSGTPSTTLLTNTSSSRVFQASGSVSTTVTDITGTIGETYAATSFP